MMKMLKCSTIMSGMRKLNAQCPPRTICSHFSSSGPTATSPPTSPTDSSATNTQSPSEPSFGEDGVVNTDEELQPQWKALENRVNSRRSRSLGSGAPQGRSPRRGSAWDHETV